MCRPKDQGGLGIEVLDIKNRSLVSKWIFKILHEEGVWHELLSNKYLKDKTLSQVEAKPTDSPFWKGLMKVKDDFFKRGSFILANGRTIRFWEDPWLDGVTLSIQYPVLYYIVRRKHVTVFDVLSHYPLNIGFHRNLVGDKWDAWLHLV